MQPLLLHQIFWREVWFADIDPNTYLIDIVAVKKLIESNQIFKGIIPVDFAGLPDMEEFRILADKYTLIIEDACTHQEAILKIMMV